MSSAFTVMVLPFYNDCVSCFVNLGDLAPGTVLWPLLPQPLLVRVLQLPVLRSFAASAAKTIVVKHTSANTAIMLITFFMVHSSCDFFIDGALCSSVKND